MFHELSETSLGISRAMSVISDLSILTMPCGYHCKHMRICLTVHPVEKCICGCIFMGVVYIYVYIYIYMDTL